MSITEEQAKKIKKQILAQIEKGFPDDRKEYAKKQIQEMNISELEEFLKQNNLTTQGQEQSANNQNQCIFCSIVEGKLPSYKISENENAIAVLDIRPASYGHTLILPKEHISSEKNLPKEAKELAEKISKTIQSKLKPKDVKIENTNFFGHEAINLIPVYKSEEPKPLDAQREEADEDQLMALQKELKEAPESSSDQKPEKIEESQSKKKEEKKEIYKVPKRIP